MSAALLERSLKELAGVDPRLVVLYGVMIRSRYLGQHKLFPVVTDGLRTKEEQLRFVQAGRSWVRNSKHMTGNALDVALFSGDRAVWLPDHYIGLYADVGSFCRALGLKWGGDWKQRDYVHYETP